MEVENLQITLETASGNLSSQLKGIQKSLSKLSSQSNKTRGTLKKLKDVFKESTDTTRKFMKSIGRVAFYRAIRSALRFITDAFKDGLKNAYQFSKGISGDLANALDGLASKSLQMKNQLGSAFGGLLQAIQPILIQIINLVTQAANAIAAFFGALNGGTYLKAKETASAWDTATGAAQKYKNTILGFDELNRLDDQSGGGGGGVDASSMFELAEAPDWAKKAAEILTEIKFNIKDVYGEWGNLNTGRIKDIILSNLPTIAGCTIIGGMVGGVRGAIVGLIAGLALTFLGSVDVDGKIGYPGLIEKIKSFVLPVAGAILGWKLGGFGGALIGLTIGTMIQLAFANEVTTSGGFSWGNFWNVLYNSGVLPIAGAIIGWKLTNSVFGTAIGLTLGTIISFFVRDFGGMQGRLDAMEIAESICKNVLPSAAGAIVGFALGGVAGAIIGLTIGVMLSFVVRSVDWSAVERAIPQGTYHESFAVNASKYASGGYPQRGDLFIAGEAGAEIVSSNGGQTQVSNTDQIAASVSVGNGVVVQAIYDLMNSVNKSIAEKDTNPVVTIGDRDVYRAYQRGSRNVGASLVSG